MFRGAISVVRAIQPLRIPVYNVARIIGHEVRNYSAISAKPNLIAPTLMPKGSLISNTQLMDICRNINPVQIRTVTKFSLRKGKRKTSKPVTKKFFRLHWGGWIRTICGRNKKLWKKSPPQKRRLRQHVFCNATQSTLLDKMVTKYWKKPKHYVDDIYAPYHTREEFPFTRTKPKEY